MNMIDWVCPHWKGPKLMRLPMPTMSGANAMSGTVCEAMTKGSRPRSKKAKRCITMARRSPTATPIMKPPKAMRRV